VEQHSCRNGFSLKVSIIGCSFVDKWLIRERSFVMYDSPPRKGKEREETPLYLSLTKKSEFCEKKKQK